jgi:hypothetical protein
MASVPSVEGLDLGALIEGVVELDPMNGRMVLRIQQADGSFDFLDVQTILEQYQGEEVRFIVTPLKSVEILARLVESGQLDPEDVPRLKATKTTH